MEDVENNQKVTKKNRFIRATAIQPFHVERQPDPGDGFYVLSVFL
jgi:hypothetical protein